MTSFTIITGENIQRNIKKAVQAGCTAQKDFDAEKVIALAVQQMKGQNKESEENIERFRKLYHLLHSQTNGNYIRDHFSAKRNGSVLCFLLLS
jgi:hypothetical protein